MLEAIVLANSLAIGLLHIILTDAGELLGSIKLKIYEADIPFISKAFCCSKCFAGWWCLVLCGVHGVEFQWVLPLLAVTMFLIKKIDRV